MTQKPVIIANAHKLDLTGWVVAVWKKRGLIADREYVLEWLKTQDRDRLEQLKASGKPSYSQRELGET